MKKLLTLILALSLTALVGCAGSESDVSSTLEGGTIDETMKQGTVELCEYKDVDLDWTAGDSKAILENALSEYKATTKEVKDRPIKNGDLVNIDFAGYKDGKAFDGGTSTGYDLEIGSGSFIPGFEEGLVGVKPGETKNLELTFPESYHSADLAGQEVVFKVTVNYIKEETYAEKDMKAAKESALGTAILINTINNSTYGPLDNELMTSYTNAYLNTYEEQITKSYGYESVEAYLKATGTSREDYDAMIKMNAENRTKYDTVVNTIAAEENIELTDAEYKQGLKELLEGSEVTESEFEKQNGKQVIEAELLARKVMEFLQGESTVE